jgi:acetyl esterase/lipase
VLLVDGMLVDKYPAIGLFFAVMSSLGAVPVPAGYFDLSGVPVEAATPVGEDGRIQRVERPVLRVFRAAHSADDVRGSLLLLPGGGYRILSAVKEGSETAGFLNGLGYDVVMLDYRVNSGDETRALALSDGVAAWRLMRASPEALGIRGPAAGVVGYSAGGHLAARVLPVLEAEERPRSVVLIYPAYLEEVDAGSGHPAVRPPEDLAGHSLMIAFAENDRAGWIEGAGAYADAWRGAGGGVVFHRFPDGGHGFGLTDLGNVAVRGLREVLPLFFNAASAD